MRTRNRRQSTSRDVGQNVHPALQAALEGLDVDLDRELSRYRRSRPQPNGGIRRFWVGLSKTGQAEAVPVPNGSQGMPPALMAANDKEASVGSLAIAPVDSSLALPSEEQSALAEALTQRPAIPQQALLDPKVALATESLESVALDQASALLKQTQNFANPDGSSPANLPPPETYAFPSVREQRRAAQRRSKGQGLSGTGIATILMMMAGTLWTYYTNYPDSDQYLQIGQTLKSIGDATGITEMETFRAIALGEQETTSTDTTAARPPVKDAPAVQGADLANQEFSELNIGRLSLLGMTPPPKKDEDVTVLGSATIPRVGIPGIPTVTQVPLANGGGAPSGQASQDKDKKTKPAQAPKITTIPEDGTRFFYVVEPYKVKNAGDEGIHLALARKYVADAYVRTLAGDRYIQFAALDKQDQAETLAKRLLAKGLTIQILHPTPKKKESSTADAKSAEAKSQAANPKEDKKASE